MVTDEMVKRAAAEYLSHKGERPYRVTRRGAELWEDHAPAMRAALEAALSAQVQDVSESKTFYTTRKNWEKMNFGSFIADEHMSVVLDATDECWANADLKITISVAPAKQEGVHD